jgi:uncharacterized protein YbbK (DUF523 family)
MIMVSSCLLGIHAKYDGTLYIFNNKRLLFVKKYNVREMQDVK